MTIDTERIISVTEANRNFSRATRIADEHGEAIVFKNNRPAYKLVNLDIEPELDLTDDEKIDVVAARIMKRFLPAFRELAKCSNEEDADCDALLVWVREHTK